MNISPKYLAIAAVGILGLAGFSSLAYANQGQLNTIVTSYKTAEASDGDGETNDDAQEKQESAKLQTLAKITPEQARQFAEANQGGKASNVKLENEDGNVVYAVAIGQKEVKVDAGNGQVLYTDSANNEGNEAKRPSSSIQVAEVSDGDGETNDDAK
ncbi:PepSY domain-containing protein [Chamaesiphon polymorphus]|uniref:Peptidase n=1 Tax=Chamaesiphon polymorphus CCALA 037 TaxID=2107692 RepID=A0A2T1G8T6_9CYAN|nr:PepSY domain-containing protein [Chamaesiphon polymorphus]PSB53566.1 peptidase [Chamaesiphon polymorphus CCALA 037]